MNNTTRNLETIKTAVLGALNGRAATTEVVCFRLGLIVNRSNMRVVRAALAELRAAKKINSHIVGGSQDVAYHV